ncbi:hypothetical protein E4T39_05561 [Aureobasidium subglaciale]|nr:hypothetical protein E4T39_05561 [Aureobasidium subglaciale]
MAQPATSAITMAFASSSYTGGLAKHSTVSNLSAAVARHGAGMPLTPPNSVSPGLPAAAQAGLLSPPPIRIDEEDGSRSALPLSKGALSGLDASQSITASMLAKHHLPGIMLGHGPIAIRHVMACLTQSVPGFSRIPPAKARRLVVAALENRAGGGDGGVVFEKVGWGRWDAHTKGERPDPSSSYRDGKLSPPPSEPGSYAASYSGSGFPGSFKPQESQQLNSWAESSMASHYDDHLENMSMEENEADKMSLDGSSSAMSEDDSVTSDSEGDETEEEDWAAMGPDALRKASVSTAASPGTRRNYNLISIPGSLHEARTPSVYGSAGGARSSFLARSTPQFVRRPSAMSYTQHRGSVNQIPPSHGTTPMEIDRTIQEREAIEALLRMGSA